jgi:hypothetical protein
VNVRFAADAVRCRVTQAELDELLQSGSLKLLVPLPRNHQFQVTVRAAVLGGWRLDSDPTGLWIEIPRSDIDQLAASLPSREGIEHGFELEDGATIRLAFEVDVRKRRAAEPRPSPTSQPSTAADSPRL